MKFEFLDFALVVHAEASSVLGITFVLSLQIAELDLSRSRIFIWSGFKKVDRDIAVSVVPRFQLLKTLSKEIDIMLTGMGRQLVLVFEFLHFTRLNASGTVIGDLAGSC